MSTPGTSDGALGRLWLPTARDLRLAVRMLLKRPSFALLVITIFGLGVGANVAIFSVAHTLFLQRLPVAEPDRLVGVFETREGRGYHPMSWADFLDYRDGATVFERLAAHYSTAPLQVAGAGHDAMLTGSVVSRDYFPMLGIRPALGRFLAAEDFERGSAPATVLSARLWRRWFDASPEALGRSLTVNGVAFTLVGIAPESFRGVLVGTTDELWIPSSRADVGYRFCDAFSRDCTYLNLLGRLRPGYTPAEARAELRVIARRLQRAYPDSHRDKGVTVVPARGVRPDGAAAQARLTTTLASIVIAVLLIACANLASLLLVRNWSRSGELAIRRALGASRGRIVAQLLTEAMLLAVLGGAAALAVGWAIRRTLATFYSLDPGWLTGSASLPVLGFTLALTLVAGLGFALIPARVSTRVDPSEALKQLRFGGREGWRAALVVAQLALSLALLVGTNLLARSLLHLERDLAAPTGRLVTLRLRPRLAGYDATRARALLPPVVDRLRSLPRVEAVSYGQGLPLLPYHDPVPVSPPGAPPDRGLDRAAARYDYVGPGYFSTLSVPLLRGRELRLSDDGHAPAVVVVNRSLATRLWPDGSWLGRRLVVLGQEREVVGIAPDIERHRPGEAPDPYFYLPYLQSDLVDSRLVVRTEGDAGAMLQELRRTIAAVDPVLPVSEVSALDDHIADIDRPVRLVATVIGFSGTVGLLLAAIGLYGTLALRVATRNREIGIRMAVGASTRDVLALVLGEGTRLALLGILLGLPLAVLLGRGLGGFLFDVSPWSPGAYLPTASALLVVALAASWLPAHRAAAVEPTAALRAE